MERSESSETSGTRETERKKERDRERDREGEKNNRGGRKWRSEALKHRPDGVLLLSPMNSIRRTTDCHWQMLPLSSLSLAFPSPIVKPMDQGVNTGLSPQKLQLQKRKQSPYPCRSKPPHAFFILFFKQHPYVKPQMYLIFMIFWGAQFMLCYVIFQDFLAFLWHSLHYQNNLCAL